MTSLLIRLFIKNKGTVTDKIVRRSYGVLSSIVGIVCNIILFTAKMIIGQLSGSISITADAINNLSDMGSCAVTLIGFNMASRPADKEHPFGHGRMEYLTSLIVAILVTSVGMNLFKESIVKIFGDAEAVSLSVPLISVLLISIAVKLWMFLFNRKIGKIINSSVMQATAADSISDVAATSAVLIATAVGYYIDFPLDGYMGAIVAAFIMLSGIKIIKESMGPILGEAPDTETAERLKKKVESYEGIVGTHDLTMHNYGPGSWIASIHAEVPSNIDIMKSHDVIDNIERDVMNELGVELVIHMDPIVIDDEKVCSMRKKAAEVMKNIDKRITIHDFRMVEGDTHTNLIFDVVVPYGCKFSSDELKVLTQMLFSEIDKKYFTVITIDRE